MLASRVPQQRLLSIYTNGTFTETGDKLPVVDGKLQYAFSFTAAEFGLLRCGIYKAKICSSCSYIYLCVLAFQGFVQGL